MKANKADNDVEAIKMHEGYLQKYPDGLYAQDRIEELSFNIAAKANTIDALNAVYKKISTRSVLSESH